jgi:hypothetical protein
MIEHFVHVGLELKCPDIQQLDGPARFADRDGIELSP